MNQKPASFSRGRLIAGIHATKVRDALRLGAQAEPFTFHLIRDVCKIGERRARELVKELVRTKHLEPTDPLRRRDRGHWYVLTPKGKKLANASAMSRLPRAKAERLLADLMRRIEEVNASTEYLLTISAAVVFGSYVRGEESLGDIDIAYEPDRKPHYGLPDQQGFLKATYERVAVARERGRTFSTFLDELGWPEREVYLHLKARTRGLSLHNMAEFYNMVKDKKFSYKVLKGDETMIANRLREAQERLQAQKKKKEPT